MGKGGDCHRLLPRPGHRPSESAPSLLLRQDRATVREARPAKHDPDRIASLGRPTIPSLDMLLGQRSDPASPAETKLPILHQQSKET